MNEITFPILDSQRWINTRKKAQQLIIDSIPVPDKKSFESGIQPHYPRWLIALVLFALFCVLAFSFAYSGTKQVIATGLIVDNLSDHFTHVSRSWTDFTIILMLGMGEIGSLIFSVGAGIYGGDSITWGKVAFKPLAWFFRLFAISCAGVAIFANIAVTALDPIPSVLFYQWFVALLIPMVVLGIGVFFERLLIDTLKVRHEIQVKFQGAMLDYSRMITAPENHQDFKAVWYECIWGELNHYKKDRTLLQTAENKAVVVKMEIISHDQWAGIDDIEIEVPANPFLSSEVNQRLLD